MAQSQLGFLGQAPAPAPAQAQGPGTPAKHQSQTQSQAQSQAANTQSQAQSQAAHTQAQAPSPHLERVADDGPLFGLPPRQVHVQRVEQPGPELDWVGLIDVCFEDGGLGLGLGWGLGVWGRTD